VAIRAVVPGIRRAADLSNDRLAMDRHWQFTKRSLQVVAERCCHCNDAGPVANVDLAMAANQLGPAAAVCTRDTADRCNHACHLVCEPIADKPAATALKTLSYDHWARRHSMFQFKQSTAARYDEPTAFWRSGPIGLRPPACNRSCTRGVAPAGNAD
jgi:hypothetical protein